METTACLLRSLNKVLWLVGPSVVVLAVFVAGGPAAMGETVGRVIRPEAAGNLLSGDAWTALGGATREDDVFVCDARDDDTGKLGFYQYVTLDQTQPLPIVATLSSQAENVAWRRGATYAMHIEVVCTDGTPLEGPTARFDAGTHGWQRQRLTIVPPKPVRTVGFRIEFSGLPGRARFREPGLCQVPLAGGTAMLDELFVQGDPRWAGGFAVRDVTGDSDFVTFDGMEPAEGSRSATSATREGKALGLTLSTSAGRDGEATKITATLSSDGSADRAVTLIYALPVRAEQVTWLANPRSDEPAEAPKCYLTTTSVSAGSEPGLSRYPLAAVAAGGKGRAVGIDMSRPAMFRVGYSTTGWLYVAYDLALTPERPSAEVAFCTYPFGAEWGFRAALERYYRLYPAQFHRRVERMGIWMPFSKISEAEGWEDFGFAFKESNNETAWDDAHGISTFHYTEPLMWWMKMPPETPRTMEAATDQAKALAAEGDVRARALLTSGFRDRKGGFVARMANTPWADGAVFSMNSSPGIAGDVTDFSAKWNPRIRQELYGPESKGDLDGEYIDSAESWGTAALDFCREHFAAARTPLTFAPDTHEPGVFKWLIVFEYVRGIADDVHAMDKLMMANTTPGRLCWLAPLLDVCGTETDWNRRGRWSPMSDEELLYRRALCGPKPFCFLMNTDFTELGHDLVEKYMKRCCAYGMFPGFFSANASTGTYFTQPDLYNRDRDLFRKYVPICRRLGEAGWRPVTKARSGDASVHVERFGDGYLTVFNDSDSPRETTIALGEPTWTRCREMLSGRDIELNDGGVSISLDGEDLAVLSLE